MNAPHPWLAQAWQEPAGVLLQLSEPGVAALRSQGRAALLRTLQTALGLPPTQPLRLLEPGQSADTAALREASLRAPRPELPRVLREQPLADGSWQLQLRIPLELVHFDGHFPATPVLPGVLQVGWALALAAPRLGTATACREIEALKFQQLLRPGDAVGLTLRWDAERGKLHFAFREGEAGYSSGRLLLERAP